MKNDKADEKLELLHALKGSELNHPEVLIIYAPQGSTAQMVGANWNGSKWLYSAKWVEMPEEDLNGFLSVFLEAKYTVFDIRAQANLVRPGMGDATPILVVRPDIDLRHASKAATELHLAIMKVNAKEITHG